MSKTPSSQLKSLNYSFQIVPRCGINVPGCGINVPGCGTFVPGRGNARKQPLSDNSPEHAPDATPHCQSALAPWNGECKLDAEHAKEKNKSKAEETKTDSRPVPKYMYDELREEAYSYRDQISDLQNQIRQMQLNMKSHETAEKMLTK